MAFGVLMHLPKRYGQSSVSACPFCGGQAFAKNDQGIPCCTKHKALRLPDLKCICGRWLDQRESKFGVFYTCMSCGAVSFAKMMDANGDAIRKVLSGTGANDAASSRPASQGGQYMVGGTVRDRVRQKLARGEPLTPDELDFI
ncbi:TPA: hypothetical protein HA251_03740 [Candidatus Woesearchaeota archaeon]|nr:hypothetical protein [Candidatus Woesearchaeota archaeon]